jgi:hypothetical protein
MKTLKRIAVITLVAMAMVLWSISAYAQATNAPAGSGAPTAAPVADLSAVWTAAIAVVVPLLVALLKKLVPKIPKPLLPIGATVLGVISDWLLAKAGALPHTSLALGALAGASGVGVREILDQLKTAVMGPTPPPTPPPAATTSG